MVALVHLVVVLGLSHFPPGLTTVEARVSQEEVDEARDNRILTTDGKVFEVDASTKYARETADGDVAAGFADLKFGTVVELHSDMSQKPLKKVRIVGNK